MAGLTSISIACPPRSARWNEEMDERSARRNQETGCQNGLRGLAASQPRMRADPHDGPADVYGRVASAVSVATDPTRTSPETTVSLETSILRAALTGAARQPA